MNVPGIGTKCVRALSAAVVLAAAVAATAEVRMQPAPGASDDYRIRMATYSGENQMPLLVMAVEYRDTALEDGRRQIDVVRAERYQPFAGIWLPSIIDSVDPAQDDLPEGVQLRVIVDFDSPIAAILPDDIPDVAFGLLTEIIQIVRAQMDNEGVGSLQQVGETASLTPFSLQWRRERTGVSFRRACAGGTAALESLEDGRAVVRWRPQTIRWTYLQVGSPNQLSRSEETAEVVMTIDTTTGLLIESKSEKDSIATLLIGPVDFAELPDWDAISVPEDAQMHLTHRFIHLQRLEDYKAEEERRQKGDDAPLGPPVPGSGH